jgi:hypothetical protein
MDGTGSDSSPNLARLVAFPVKHFLNYVPLPVMCPVVVSKNSNQACFAAPSHASPFRHSEDQL